MEITLVCHSSVLIEGAGVSLLTDPLLSPDSVRGSRPVAPPALSVEQAINADIVLVSHAHADHVDPAFFARLPEATPVVVPAGLRWPRRVPRPSRVRPLELWEKYRFGNTSLTVTAVPALHLGTACGYVVEAEGLAIYFAGDTRFGPHLDSIGRSFDLELALLSLSRTRFVPVIHPEDVVPAALALRTPAVALIHLMAVKSRLLTLPDPTPEVERLLSLQGPDIRLERLQVGVPLRLSRE